MAKVYAFEVSRTYPTATVKESFDFIQTVNGEDNNNYGSNWWFDGKQHGTLPQFAEVEYNDEGLHTNELGSNACEYYKVAFSYTDSGSLVDALQLAIIEIKTEIKNETLMKFALHEILHFAKKQFDNLK